MQQSKFDLVMDYIDENIQKDSETIKRGIINIIGINSHTFGQFFTVLTNDTLGSYIRSRRLYFAAKSLQGELDKSICDIALEYGYSDQSAFTRAFNTQYGFPPGELRQEKHFYFIENNKFLFDDFTNQIDNSYSSRIWREFERTGFLSGSDLDFIQAVDEGSKYYNFDIDTAYAIADLAERLEVPICALMHSCFDLIVELESDPGYLSHRKMREIEEELHQYHKP